MGRPNPVLRFVTTVQWLEHPAIKELIAEGHHVVAILDEDFVNADAIIAPNAHGWHEAMFEAGVNNQGQSTAKRPYVEAMKVAARKRRRGRK